MNADRRSSKSLYKVTLDGSELIAAAEIIRDARSNRIKLFDSIATFVERIACQRHELCRTMLTVRLFRGRGKLGAYWRASLRLHGRLYGLVSIGGRLVPFALARLVLLQSQLLGGRSSP